ncbi:MAG TPA: class I SAM-dependent DNA methyltransferase [Bacteroidales bacterium]|nr:class I SAM-dependent DNA methyltransferase [Bacteroidales bacterium]HOR82323.1 class I SAM-dependent DNA methyltransferase [Bacteroidales bacterium]HPJ91591.1 class I SAM-dependent DNA methyltransferase [Bacteroidales bacterium]
MAKKNEKDKAIEVSLWESANKLRGSVEPSEYKHVVLALIFLKFVSDKFEEQRQKLIKDGKEKYVERPEFYNMNNVFFLKEETRWTYIVSKSRQNDIALIIDTALHTIEKDNKALKGALPDNYFSRLALDTSKLAALISEIDNIDTLKDKEQDVIGRIYEYFLSKFAIAEGKGKGEFYTPKSIVNLIAEMIEPYKGVIYDPCCGSGGMFVQSVKFIEAHHGNKKEISIYGQEYTNTTYKLAKMNLAIRGISANLGERAANSFSNDQHKDLKADFIMANPPFNQKDWRAENELLDDPRWKGYEIPPTSNANYGWILHMASKLSDHGVAGFLLANGALSGGGDEYKIRKQLIENDLVEAILILPRNMFYTTDISVTLWILNKNKKKYVRAYGNTPQRNYRDRQKEILFMDLREMGEPFEKKYIQLSEKDIKKITDTYHNWQCWDNAMSLSATSLSDMEETDNLPAYQDVPEFCYSAGIEEIREKDYSLVPSRYIEFVNRDEEVDFDEKMKTLQQEIGELLQKEKQSRNELLRVFEDLGFKIELK